MHSQSFTVTQPTRIRFGVDAINDLPALVKRARRQQRFSWWLTRALSKPGWWSGSPRR